MIRVPRAPGLPFSVVLLLGLHGIALSLSAGTDWPGVGGDPALTRSSPLQQIDRSNVAHLEVAWTFRTGGASQSPLTAIQCTPIVIGGTMYLTSPDTQVIALDAATGVEKWRYNPHRHLHRYLHNRGVAFWSDGDRQHRILFATPDGFLYSLDAATGQLDPTFGSRGIVDLRHGVDADLRNAIYGATAAPVVFEDRVIVGISLDEGYRGGPGDIRAFDVHTGREVWRFHTVPRPGEFGHDTWAGDSWRNRTGVNAWSGASVDPTRGLVFVATGSPGYDFYGGDRAGDNLFANCVIALDGRTGKRLWHRQLVHHDVWDYDLPYPPILVTITRDAHPVDAVAQITKHGFVFLFERTTGEPLFDIVERPVPQSDLPGERTAPTQPFPELPPPFASQGFSTAHITDRTPEAHDAVTQRLAHARYGELFTPPSHDGTPQNPGTLGGANWSGASFDAGTARLFLNANNFPRLLRLESTGQPEAPYLDRGDARIFDPQGFPGVVPPWGTLAAIDLNRGEIAWQVPLGEFPALNRRGLPPTGTPNLGGCIVTAGGLVFVASTMDEKIRAFDRADGRLLWQHQLPFAGYAAPATYSIDGRQFVVIAAGGGGKLGTPAGDVYVAFALPSAR